MFIPRLTAVFALALFLCGCSDFDMSDAASAAKARMIGMPREDVLACMGPARKKAKEGDTEVWSYLSTNDRSDYSGDLFKSSSYNHSGGSHDRSFCTVNIVMKNGIVTAVRYNGPTSTHFYTPDDQCGFAVANCVPETPTDK